MKNDTTPLLSLSGVTKSFGSLQSLRDIDLDIRHGELLGLLGDNGAAKSTLIKTLAGVNASDRLATSFAVRTLVSVGRLQGAKILLSRPVGLRWISLPRIQRLQPSITSLAAT